MNPDQQTLVKLRVNDAEIRITSVSSSNPLLKLPVFMWQVYDYSKEDFGSFTELIRTDRSILGTRSSLSKTVADLLQDYDGSLSSALAIFEVFDPYKKRLEIKVKMKKDSRGEHSIARAGVERLDARRLKYSDDIN